MKRYKQTGKEIFFEILGSVLVAVGVYNFAAASRFPLTGFSGIAMIINRMFHLPIGMTIIALNIPVSILCFRLLGKRFFLRSLRCILISSLMIDYLAPLFPVYEGSRMISALCTGVFCGIGYAVIYMQNSSTGGTDFIIMAIKAVKPYLSLGKIAFLAEVGIIFTGGLLFRDLDGIVYGMIINFLIAVVVDKVIYGINSGKVALIVTEHGKTVCNAINTTCGRGSTILNGSGGFQKDEKQVVMCACSNRQMYDVQQAVKVVDPGSFTVVLESSEVHGNGFQMFAVGDHQ